MLALVAWTTIANTHGVTYSRKVDFGRYGTERKLGTFASFTILLPIAQKFQFVKIVFSLIVYWMRIKKKLFLLKRQGDHTNNIKDRITVNVQRHIYGLLDRTSVLMFVYETWMVKRTGDCLSGPCLIWNIGVTSIYKKLKSKLL